MLASWQTVWRDGLSHCFSKEQLLALANGLRSNDKCLVQGSTTSPPPLQHIQDWPVEACDAIGYAYWRSLPSDYQATVGDVEEWFAKCCFDTDVRLGELAACRWFLNWFDDTPRDRMRVELLEEVERSISLLNGT